MCKAQPTGDFYSKDYFLPWCNSTVDLVYSMFLLLFFLFFFLFCLPSCGVLLKAWYSPTAGVCFLGENESLQQWGDGGCSWGSLCSWQPFAFASVSRFILKWRNKSTWSLLPWTTPAWPVQHLGLELVQELWECPAPPPWLLLGRSRSEVNRASWLPPTCLASFGKISQCWIFWEYLWGIT